MMIACLYPEYSPARQQCSRAKAARRELPNTQLEIQYYAHMRMQTLHGVKIVDRVLAGQYVTQI